MSKKNVCQLLLVIHRHINKICVDINSLCVPLYPSMYINTIIQKYTQKYIYIYTYIYIYVYIYGYICM